MVDESSSLRTAEELIAELDRAFKIGELGVTALFAWEAMVRFPEIGPQARIYIKKILRDSNIASIGLDSLKANAKAEREAENYPLVAEICAIGLFKFPGDRLLTLNFIDSLDNVGRQDLIPHALEPLGEPSSTDVVMLNAHAAMAQQQGDYEKAHRMFKQLVTLEPKNTAFIQNYSAALTGLSRYEDAITTLESTLEIAPEPKEYLYRLAPLYHRVGENVAEKFIQLDDRYFVSCESTGRARAHADIRIFLQDVEGVRRGLSLGLELEWNPDWAFELAEVELALDLYEEGLDRYEVRFEAFPYLVYCEPQGKPYRGEVLTNESLFVWGEQGIGEEVMFCYFFEELNKRVRDVTVALDPRLIPYFSNRFPHWTFLNRHRVADDLPVKDYCAPTGDLFRYLGLSAINGELAFSQPLLVPREERAKQIHGLLGVKTKPRIGISWRGGKGIHGKIRSMELDQMMSGVTPEEDLEIISFQYTEGHKEEVISHGDRRVAISGLDNFTDLDGVFALMASCDAIITVDNAVAHFAGALGVPVMVVVPAGQTQFRWKNDVIRRMFFPSAQLFSQEPIGDWRSAVKRAWDAALGTSVRSEWDGEATSC